MSDDTVEAPGAQVRQFLRQGWNTLLTVYYANSVGWRVLKAGALVFLGLFAWAGANILLSVQPGWTLLHYVVAYGFLLVIYGPFHHLVVIPLALRWRRRGGSAQSLGRHLPNAGLALFLLAVLVLGTFPAGPTTIDFASALEGTGADVNPDLACVKSPADGAVEIHCHLTESAGVDRVVVESGDRRLAVDRDPPFEFTVRADQVAEVVGSKQFRVLLLDRDGTLLRRYTRRLDMIREG